MTHAHIRIRTMPRAQSSSLPFIMSVDPESSTPAADAVMQSFLVLSFFSFSEGTGPHVWLHTNRCSLGDCDSADAHYRIPAQRMFEDSFRGHRSASFLPWTDPKLVYTRAFASWT